MFQKTGYIFFISLLIACSNNKLENNNRAIARVNNSFLYLEDIKDLVPAGTAKNDSLIIVKDFIDRWASQKLLFEAAEKNLSNEKQNELKELIEQYKKDLFTKAYIEQLVFKSFDTLISTEELKKYYETNKEKFKTNEALVKLSYVQINKKNPKINALTQTFLSNKKALNKNLIELKSYAFNDSIWIDMSQVYEKLPFINNGNKDRYLIPGKTIKHADSLDIFLIKTVSFLPQNQTSPYQYIEPTLKKVIHNNRKIELIQKFQKEITQDAIKEKDYEIFKK